MGMRVYCLLLLILLVGSGAKAQDDTQPVLRESKENLPYTKYPELPAFNVMLTDSNTIFNTYNIPKGSPVLLVFFDPECRHCKAVTQRMMDGMDSLKDVQMYFITHLHDMQSIKKFAEDHHFEKYPNIKVVGRDYEYFNIAYYGVSIVPDFVLYDADKMFIKYFEGTATVSDLYEWFHKKTK
jgi:thioredoxin-related protein